MCFKKGIISFLLLFTYSLGFSHDLIPHCHHNEGTAEHVVEHSEDHGHHHHEHHSHYTHGSHDHEHGSEHDHGDEGLLDFIICLLGETAHPVAETDAGLYIPGNSVDVPLNKSIDTKYAAILLAWYCEMSADEDHRAITAETGETYLPPLLSDSPHRGPPLIVA